MGNERMMRRIAAICGITAALCIVMALQCWLPCGERAFADPPSQTYSGGSTSISIQTLEHEVTIDPGSGEGQPVTTSYIDGESFLVPQCPYTHPTDNFAYWTRDPEGEGEAIYPDQPMTATESMTLYAQWSLGAPPTGVKISSSRVATLLLWLTAGLLASGAAASFARSRRRTKEERREENDG